MSGLPPASIATERLRLRSWRADDAGILREALNVSLVEMAPWVPWATTDPVGSEEALERASLWQREFHAGESFVYAVFESEGAELVGGAGLYGRVGPGALEIGYWIRSDRTGRGYATEASRG